MSYRVIRFNSNRLIRYVVGFGMVLASIGTFSCSIATQDTEPRLTVYVHGPKGKEDPVGLVDMGRVMIKTDEISKMAPIKKGGKAEFGKISPELLGKSVSLYVTKMGWATTHPDSLYVLDGSPIYLAVERIIHLEGKVIDATSFKAIPEARVTFLDQQALTTSNGSFYFQIPNSLNKDRFTLTFQAEGYQTKKVDVTPIVGKLDIRMRSKEDKQ